MLREIHDLLRRLVVVEKAEIFLIEVANEFSVLVGGDEQHIHFVHTLANGDYGICVDGCGDGKGASACDKGILCRRLGVAQRQRHRKTENQAYVLHSQTIQKLHNQPLLACYNHSLDARPMPKNRTALTRLMA